MKLLVADQLRARSNIDMKLTIVCSPLSNFGTHFFPTFFQDDRELAMAAVQQNCGLLSTMQQSIALPIAHGRGDIFPFLSFNLKAEKDLVLQVVKEKGALLKQLGSSNPQGSKPKGPKPCRTLDPKNPGRSGRQNHCV